MNILVIRISAMGDVAMLAAVLREAATCYPANDYTLLSTAKMEALLMVMPKNVHFVAYGSPIDWSQYDHVMDAHSVWRSWRLDIQALLHGIPVRRIHKPRWQRWLLVHHRITQVPSMLSLYRALLQVKESTPHQPQSVTRRDIGIAPFAAHTGKIYPMERMEQVVQRLAAEMAKRKEQVLLFGAGEKETAILRQWATRYPHVRCVAGTLSLQEELEEMRHLRGMVCMDSANMHLASLVGTRVISIWGATHPNAGFLGYGQQISDCIQQDLPCRPCSIYGQRECLYKDYRCLAIPVQHILNRLAL